MSPSDLAPTGLADDHVLLAVDELVDDPVLDGVYDPRFVSLTADGTLVLGRQGTDAILDTTVTKLDRASLGRAWSAISGSGIFTDGNLDLPGFREPGGRSSTDVFRVDDGMRSTRLVIASLGSERIYTGAPPLPAAELATRTAATGLIDDLSAMGGADRWTPPALLLWWRSELPADWNAVITQWSLPIDLASAGHAIEHSVWDRCARLDGDEAASVARMANALAIDHLVELDGVRYGLNVRAIHPDEIDKIDCP